MNKEFISLREFLLLKEDFYLENPKEYLQRSVFGSNVKLNYSSSKSAQEEMVEYYDIAKKSWEKYGDIGPPVGIKVQTLVSGHGGGAGVVRVMDFYF